MLVAPMGGVAGGLLWVDVVSEQARPPPAEPRPGHAPAGEELVVAERHLCRRGRASTEVSLSSFSWIASVIQVFLGTFLGCLLHRRSVASKVSGSRRKWIQSKGQGADSRRAECMAPCCRQSGSCQRNAGEGRGYSRDSMCISCPPPPSRTLARPVKQGRDV